MITPYRRPTDGIVNRKGKIQNGPAARGSVERGKKPGIPVLDGPIQCDRSNIVENQRNRKGPAIGRDRSSYEEGSTHQSRPIHAPNGSGSQRRTACCRHLGWHEKDAWSCPVSPQEAPAGGKPITEYRRPRRGRLRWCLRCRAPGRCRIPEAVWRPWRSRRNHSAG